MQLRWHATISDGTKVIQRTFVAETPSEMEETQYWEGEGDDEVAFTIVHERAKAWRKDDVLRFMDTLKHHYLAKVSERVGTRPPTRIHPSIHPSIHLPVHMSDHPPTYSYSLTHLPSCTTSKP